MPQELAFWITPNSEYKVAEISPIFKKEYGASQRPKNEARSCAEARCGISRQFPAAVFPLCIRPLEVGLLQSYWI